MKTALDTQTDAAWTYALDRDWNGSQLTLSDYPALFQAWNHSRSRLQHLRDLLSNGMPEEILCVGVAGSLARMEATRASDCDLMVILQPEVDPRSQAAQSAFQQVWRTLDGHDFGQPESDGIYSVPVSLSGLLDPETIGHVAEDPVHFGCRITFLLELQPVYGEARFRQTTAAILDRYAHQYLELDESKQWTYLLNDLVRYFKSLCQTYLFAELPEDRRWRLRNLKARHSRVLMYAGLLFLLGESSRLTSEKRSWLTQRMTWTPLERLAACYEIYGDDQISVIAESLDRFVDVMSQPGFREGLAATEEQPGTLRREANPDFQRLKQNGDQFLAELVRFAISRRGDWAERFFQYWLF